MSNISIGFIGAGKVATAFGHCLHERNVTICGYFDRHPTRAVNAATLSKSTAFSDTARLTDASDIILITTQDDYIKGVCEAICQAGHISSRHLVGHMSGALPSSILKAARAMGATIFSLHPLQAFADEESALEALPSTFFSLEGQGEGLPEIERLLSHMGNPYFWIDSDHKRLYHLSACVLSNYLVTLIDQGLAALEKSGVDRQEGFQAMQQLMDGTLANVRRMGTEKALTGPIARGDGGTVRGHIEALEAAQMNDYKSFYTFMGRLTLELATRGVLRSADAVAELRRLLA
jgi:predicted short-subunit dehydrogenase-like oxidoreductase (DUF2520 family)